MLTELIKDHYYIVNHSNTPKFKQLGRIKIVAVLYNMYGYVHANSSENMKAINYVYKSDLGFEVAHDLGINPEYSQDEIK